MGGFAGLGPGPVRPCRAGCRRSAGGRLQALYRVLHPGRDRRADCRAARPGRAPSRAGQHGRGFRSAEGRRHRCLPGIPRHARRRDPQASQADRPRHPQARVGRDGPGCGRALRLPERLCAGHALRRCLAPGAFAHRRPGRHPELVLGLSHEFLGRADGWPGLAERYRLPHKPIGIDHGIAYEALQSGRISVTDIYSTDSKIAELGLAVLRGRCEPTFRATTPCCSTGWTSPQRFPAAWKAILALEGRIPTARMIEMNGEAELKGRPFADIARDFVTPSGAAGKTGRAGFIDRLLADDLGRLTRRACIAGADCRGRRCRHRYPARRPCRGASTPGAGRDVGGGGAPDGALARPVRDAHPAAWPDRHGAGAGRAGLVRAAADRPQHHHGPHPSARGPARCRHRPGHEAWPALVGGGPAPGGAGDPGGGEDGGRDHGGHGHHRRLHRCGRLRRAHRHRAWRSTTTPPCWPGRCRRR